MTTFDVLVVGAGVTGLTVALALADAGVRVGVIDGGPPHASAAAAGMIAPASEAVLDEVTPDTADLWRAAAAAWSGLAGRLGVRLDRSGALHAADAHELDRRAARAASLGFAVGTRPTPDGRAGLLLPDDAVLDAREVLRALRAAVAARGGVLLPGEAAAGGAGVMLAGRPVAATWTVVAAGWGASRLAGLAPELAMLTPVKGQLLRLAASPGEGPTLRAPDVYLAPQPWGWAAGATMEPGLCDLRPDPERLRRLAQAVAALRPELAGAPATPAVGVRAATPDGAPLVGVSRGPGVLLATGMRRNGWLLAPLVAATVAAYASGRDPRRVAGDGPRAWDPARFDPPP